MGPRRRRHEGHGRDDPVGRARARRGPARAPSATSCSASSPTRRPAATYGAHWLVDQHPDLFEGCTEAIGEVGGFSLTLGAAALPDRDRREGHRVARLDAKGRAGHGSMINDENAVTRLAEAVARIGRHEWPMQLTPRAVAARRLRRHCRRRGRPRTTRAAWSRSSAAPRAMIGATLRNTLNPTMLDGRLQGQRDPGEATAHIDGRFLPGGEDEFLATIDELLGDARPIEHAHQRHRRRDDVRRRPRRRDDAAHCSPRTRRARSPPT